MLRHGEVRAEGRAALQTVEPVHPFTRLFPDLVGARNDPAELAALAARRGAGAGTVEDINPPPGTQADPDASVRTPAGFTFLGQFIDHDLTLTLPASPGVDLGLTRDAAIADVRNGRTANFELDSVFGTGPEAEPSRTQLYTGYRLKTGPDTGGAAWDLPRDRPAPGAAGARIGDARNDENIILAQIHARFIAAFNRMFEEVPAGGSDGQRYAEARVRLLHTYQFIVRHDYLPRFVDPAVLADVVRQGAPLYRAMMERAAASGNDRHLGLMPLEFAVSAFRFGHSQVRAGYRLNLGPGSAAALFAPDPTPDLNGGRHIPAELALNPSLFFAEPGPLPQGVTPTRRIDTRLSTPLFQLEQPGIGPGGGTADNPTELVRRNLFRGRQLQLPSGQQVAAALGLPVIPAQELGLDALPGLRADTPLWYYVLREAERVAAPDTSERLGPVGSRILAEVFIGILLTSRNSFLVSQGADWTPPGGITSMAKLMAFAPIALPAGR